MQSQSYFQQYSRVKRFFNRFKQINNGRVHDLESSNYEDEVYAFFQNCYHLKDWIKHDPACSNWSKVETLINTNPDLAMCADLCNALKHLTLTRDRRSSENPTFSGSHITLNITDGLGVNECIDISIRYNISTKSGNIDAFELANRCIAAWDSFIKSNGGAP